MMTATDRNVHSSLQMPTHTTCCYQMPASDVRSVCARIEYTHMRMRTIQGQGVELRAALSTHAQFELNTGLLKAVRFHVPVLVLSRTYSSRFFD